MKRGGRFANIRSARLRLEGENAPSELADNVTHDGQARELAGMFDEIPALQADDVADLLVYTAALPQHASLPNVPILPAKQA